MKAHFKKTISVLVLFAMLFKPIFSVGAGIAITASAQKSAPKPYQIIIESDDDGNIKSEYYVDSEGNRVEPESVPIISAAADLPSTYDIRDFGYVTSVKSQAGAGSCWSFASISNMESSMIKQGYKTASDVDYSEAHLVWFAQRQRTTDTTDPTYGDGIQLSNPFSLGAAWDDAVLTLARGSGVQLEANAPWTETWDDNVMLSSMTQPESSRYDCYARLYNAYYIYDNSVTTAKQLLIQNGNLQLAYYDMDSGYNATHYSYYQNEISGTSNHAVTVVGWDDNFSRYNFNSSMRPSKNGAWLIKGSWGDDFGDNGYYWLSYHDPSIKNLLSYVAAPKEIFDNIYQYNGSVARTYYYEPGPVMSANRFKAERNETLTHVGFFHSNQKPVNLKVEVYLSNSGYTVPTSNDPTKNMTIVSSATTTVSNSYYGYYTIELENPVELERNRYFTIKVTTTAVDGGDVWVNVEGKDVYNHTFSANKGESFIRFGSTWYDCTSIGSYNGRNAPIKAFTKETVSAYTLSYDANGGTGAPTAQTGSNEYTISTTIPTRFGYTFIGWETSPTATSARFFPGDGVRLSGNATLYAVWKAASAISASTTYNTSIDFANQEVYYSFTPSSSGKYTFESTGSLDSRIYLYNSSTEIGYDDDSGDSYNFKLTATLTSGTKYYFKIRAYNTNTGSTSFKVTRNDVPTYTITYNANGGTNAPSAQIKEKDSPLTLSTARPSKAYTVTYNANGGSVSPSTKSVSCTFKNWNTAQNGSGTSYAPGANYTANSSATLYAQWTNPTYGILATPTRTGYIFNGWFTASAGGTKITSSTILTGNTTIYAQWAKAVTYTITYNANGGTNAPSSQTKTKDVSLTLTDKIPSKAYTVTYNANGGSVSPSTKSVSCTFKNWNTAQNGSGTSYTPGANYTANSSATLYAQWANPTYGILATPTRTGYIFDGWFTASAGGTKITSSTTLTGNKTIYAHWTESPYEGMCGNTLLWNFDYTTGHLYINGIGTMYNYKLVEESDSPDTTAPWNSFKDEITAITINEDAESIGDFAFAGCTNVTSVTLPESLKSIGNASFMMCEKLEKIVIPEHVSNIGLAAFTFCSSLEEVAVDSSNDYFSDDSSGVLYDKKKTTLIHYPAGNKQKSYTIASGTKVIAPFAFAYCDNVLNFTVPSSVRTIGDSAFEREAYYISNVNYNGSPTDWNNIDVKEGNYNITAPLAINFTTKVVYNTDTTIINDTYADIDGLSYTWNVTNGKAKISASSDGTRCAVDFTRTGNLSIEMTVTDGVYTEKVTYNFTVKYVWWQWIILILLFGWIWY